KLAYVSPARGNVAQWAGEFEISPYPVVFAPLWSDSTGSRSATVSPIPRVLSLLSKIWFISDRSCESRRSAVCWEPKFRQGDITGVQAFEICDEERLLCSRSQANTCYPFLGGQRLILGVQLSGEYPCSLRGAGFGSLHMPDDGMEFFICS